VWYGTGCFFGRLLLVPDMGGERWSPFDEGCRDKAAHLLQSQSAFKKNEMRRMPFYLRKESG
jgi:hypothetical protein